MKKSKWTARRLSPYTLLFILSLFLATGCQKDKLEGLDPYSGSGPNENPQFDRFNEFGPKLEHAISFAVADHDFAKHVIDLSQERRDGDFEILLRSVLDEPMDNGQSAMEILLAEGQGMFASEELSEFVKEYPSTIVGVRGNPTAWFEGKTVPVVKFVEWGFEEKTPSTQATQSGEPVTLNLTQEFEEAVIAIHLSERHDFNGMPVMPLEVNDLPRQANPGIGASDVTDAESLPTLCGPEPSSCSGNVPNLVSFTATPQNGGMRLDYNITNFPPTLCHWGKITIKRINPNGSTKTWWRFAHMPNFFYDNTGGPNVTYTYEIDVRMSFINPSGPVGQYTRCSATNNLQTATATYPASGPAVSTYTGKNLGPLSLRYDWSAPLGAAVSEYRIRRSNNSSWTQVSPNMPATQTSFFYNMPNSFPNSDHGKLIETQIQYRSGGPWQGNFFDRTYTSYRNPGQPFYYHGVRLGTNFYEIGENPLLGAPEVRLVALQASASGTPIVLANTLIPMSGCTRAYPPFGFHYNNGDFYPSATPRGYKILNQWSSDLYGSAIRVQTAETDFHQVVVTSSSQVQTDTKSVSAKLGLKILKLEGSSIGYTSTLTNTTTTNIRYPVDDIPIGDDLIQYHEPRKLTKGFSLFGYFEHANHCGEFDNYF